MQNIVLFALVFVLGAVHASHYRGGTFSYEKLGKNTVRVKWRLAAKRSWGLEYECKDIGQTMTGEYNGVLRCIDCGGETKIAGPLTYDCVGYSETQDWSVVEGYANFTSDRSTFTLFYQVEPESQCKAASNWIDLVNAAGRSCWRLVTKVDLEKKN
ncbi:hypothetical protein, partial [Salmonella sp. s51090]|uniref:hypothetical protein n=1 Tax=Salmonella sp. s51090 TaxID=3159651 RepID=UPI00397E91DB